MSELEIDWEDLARRKAAEMENMKTRFARQQGETEKFAAVSAISPLFLPLDDARLALKHGENADLSRLVDALLRELTHQGFSVVDPGEDDEFDPATMEALEQTGEGTKTVEVLRVGWIKEGRTLRPALVKVG